MKKMYVVGLIVVLLVIILATFYFLNNRNAGFDKTVSQLGFNVSEEFKGISAKVVCQDSNCLSLFPSERLNNCNSIWNYSYEGSSAVGKPFYVSTSILSCENKKFVYYSESPPTKIRVAELKD